MADAILIHYEQVVENLTLVPSNGGRFEISVDGELIFSKLETQRHAKPEEVVKLLKSRAAKAEQQARQGF